jgi:L-alanine-DL-glutamate epimerase-like enolase superfamily enzyme
LAEIGEVRANITYSLTPPEERGRSGRFIDSLQAIAVEMAEPEDILAATQKIQSERPHVATAAVENALVEGMARRRDISVAQWLGGRMAAPASTTNQCLFWSPDERFDRLARRFLKEGFRQIKSADCGWGL